VYVQALTVDSPSKWSDQKKSASDAFRILYEPPSQERCNSAAQKKNLLGEMASSLLDSYGEERTYGLPAYGMRILRRQKKKRR
jgi:hypothetical protein